MPSLPWTLWPILNAEAICKDFLSYVQIGVHTEERRKRWEVASMPVALNYIWSRYVPLGVVELCRPCHSLAYHGFLPICLGTGELRRKLRARSKFGEISLTIPIQSYPPHTPWSHHLAGAQPAGLLLNLLSALSCASIYFLAMSAYVSALPLRARANCFFSLLGNFGGNLNTKDLYTVLYRGMTTSKNTKR
jgi:hypothetical protein